MFCQEPGRYKCPRSPSEFILNRLTFSASFFVEGRKVMKGNEMNSEVLCPVCGCGFEEKHKIVTCEECLTPHHHDCWDYSGKCAIYGCSATIPGANITDSRKKVSRIRKSRVKTGRKPAVLTKSVSSVAHSSFQKFNNYFVLIYKKLCAMYNPFIKISKSVG